MINPKPAGFSLVEVLIAALLFSIMLVGLINYQQQLITKHQLLFSQLKAHQIAFQILDSYPISANELIPENWHHKLDIQSFSQECNLITVTLNLPRQIVVRQKRLICHFQSQYKDQS